MTEDQMQPKHLHSIGELLQTLKEYAETHLLLGIGSVDQYDCISDVEHDLEPWLADVQGRVHGKPWLLLYGGDSAIEDAPDVGLLAKRLSRRPGCYVMAPLVQLGPTPPPPHDFLTLYHAMPPCYEDDLGEAATQQPSGPQQQLGAETTVPPTVPAAVQPAVSPTVQPIAKLDEWLAEAVGEDGGKVSTVGMEEEGVSGGEAEGGHVVGVNTAGGESEAAGVLGKRARKDVQGLNEAEDKGEGCEAGAREEGPTDDGCRRAGNRPRLSEQPSSAPAPSTAQTEAPAPAARAIAKPAVPAPAAAEIAGGAAQPGGGDGGGGGGGVSEVGAPPARRKVLWGGVRNGRPVGPSALLLHDAILEMSESGRRLLTSVVVAGGGDIAVQELQYAISKGVPYKYIRCRSKNKIHGEYGRIDSWLQQQQQQQQEQRQQEEEQQAQE